MESYNFLFSGVHTLRVAYKNNLCIRLCIKILVTNSNKNKKTKENFEKKKVILKQTKQKFKRIKVFFFCLNQIIIKKIIWIIIKE